MKNLFALFFLELFFVAIASCQSMEEKAQKIHQEVLTVDLHTDTPLKFVNDNFDLTQWHDSRIGGGKIDIPRMEKGGLDAVFFAAFVGQGPNDSLGLMGAYLKANEIFDSVNHIMPGLDGKAEIAWNPADAYRLEKEGKRAIYLGIENGYVLANKVDNVDYFYSRGARYITLCHTKNNDLADSSTDDKGPVHNGISPLGEKVIRRMNELGMMVDMSHASDSAFFDAIRISKAPIIASHSCARAICDNPRNLTDTMLRALAKNGGGVFMCILSDYVKKMPSYSERDSAKAAFRAKHTQWDSYTPEQRRNGIKEWYQLDVDFPPILANVSDVVDHIDHMVKVAGIEHVGIGTDFDGGGGVEGCFDVSEMGNITLELVKRGYSDEDIRKIWGGNFIRVFREVESASRNR
ncbi:MAG: hypothetical protein A2W95_06505 [Bacteroidetes bacterium GWA2_40_14]|nr:MAG: hypothetical protein A2W95_06505 [Bacteroidetes bacterium GWA2_40_14]HAZ03292.1 membrane dipeptidase [Marinilabiliales bacterium]